MKTHLRMRVRSEVRSSCPSEELTAAEVDKPGEEAMVALWKLVGDDKKEPDAVADGVWIGGTNALSEWCGNEITFKSIMESAQARKNRKDWCLRWSVDAKWLLVVITLCVEVEGDAFHDWMDAWVSRINNCLAISMTWSMGNTKSRPTTPSAASSLIPCKPTWNALANASSSGEIAALGWPSEPAGSTNRKVSPSSRTARYDNVAGSIKKRRLRPPNLPSNCNAAELCWVPFINAPLLNRIKSEKAVCLISSTLKRENHTWN